MASHIDSLQALAWWRILTDAPSTFKDLFESSLRFSASIGVITPSQRCQHEWQEVGWLWTHKTLFLRHCPSSCISGITASVHRKIDAKSTLDWLPAWSERSSGLVWVLVSLTLVRLLQENTCWMWCIRMMSEIPNWLANGLTLAFYDTMGCRCCSRTLSSSFTSWVDWKWVNSCYNTVRAPALCIHDTLDMFIFFLPTLFVTYLMLNSYGQPRSLIRYHSTSPMPMILFYLWCRPYP